MENTIAKRENDSADIRQLVRQIVRESPQLADLSKEQLEVLARAVVVDNMKEDLARRVELAKIDYQAERATFLKNAGRTRSPHTERAYRAALDKLEAWAATKGLAVLEMGFKDADDYAYSLSAEGRAAASVNRDIAVASAFFSWIERRHDSIRNPFRGTKARPKPEAKRDFAVPPEAGLSAILAQLHGPIRAAAVVMATRGLRVGALPGLSIRDGRFITTSKGKKISGDLPPEALKALKGLGAKPFADMTETRIADQFRYAVEKLFKAGELKAVYSVHDLRHYYAIQQYRADKDIYRLKGLLGHASIGVTERYLRSIGKLEA